MSRPHCDRCLRPQATCLCSLAVPTPHNTEVLILQHPMEVHHAKNTARLLHLSLPGSRIAVGEQFDTAALQALMPTPKYTVLLYPPTAYSGHVVPPAVDRVQLLNPANVRLLVLDATWRKSRKMLHLSPALQCLPRLTLHNVPEGRYAIRKAHVAGQLSTLDATCAALVQLEGEDVKWQCVLDAMDCFVALQCTLRDDRANIPRNAA